MYLCKGTVHSMLANPCGLALSPPSLFSISPQAFFSDSNDHNRCEYLSPSPFPIPIEKYKCTYNTLQLMAPIMVFLCGIF